MRRLFLATASLFAVAASAQEKWVEAPVTLALTAATSGSETLKPGAKAGTATRAVPLITSRLDNKAILEALVANGDITEIKGWRLVAIWAEWTDEDPYAGNAYRFFVRKGKGATLQTIPVPSSILSFEPLQGAYGVKHTLAGEEQEIIGGSETAEIFGELVLSAAGLNVQARGVLSTKGRYVHATRESLTYFVPGSGKIAAAGLSDGSGEIPVHVIGGTLSFAAAKFVKATDYEIPSSAGSASGTLNLGGSYANNPGAGSLQGALQINAGSTLTIGTYSSSFSTFTLSPNSAGNLLITNGGTLTLAGGEIIVIEPGVAFALATFTPEQLTGATVSVNPPAGSAP